MFVLAKLKEWGWAVLLAVFAVLSALFLRKPKWVKNKEKEISERDKDIEQAKDKSDGLTNDYEEAKAKHDEEINEAGKPQDTKPFTDPDDAASFIDDIISKRQ